MVSESVGTGLGRMPAVPPNPFPVNVQVIVQREQFSPQVLVLQGSTATVAPSLALPTSDVEEHSVDEQFRIRAKPDLGAGGDRA